MKRSKDNIDRSVPFSPSIKRMAFLARARVGESKEDFIERMKSATMNGNPLVFLEKPRLRNVPAEKINNKWINHTVWTAKIVEEHYG